MIIEIGLQTSLIGAALVPDHLLADLIEQQTVVVFLLQVFHLRISCRQRVRTTVHHLLSREGAGRGVHLTLHTLLGNLFADTLLFDTLHNLSLQ